MECNFWNESQKIAHFSDVQRMSKSLVLKCRSSFLQSKLTYKHNKTHKNKKSLKTTYIIGTSIFWFFETFQKKLLKWHFYTFEKIAKDFMDIKDPWIFKKCQLQSAALFSDVCFFADVITAIEMQENLNR